jgi:glycosyltransferase involved in cell wall biosynthesis
MTARGAYVAKLDLAQPHLSGVAEKIRAQTAALARLPAQVDVYHLDKGKVVRNGVPVGGGGLGILGRRFAHYVLFNMALAARREPLDFLYMRYQGSSPLLLWALHRLRRRNPGMRIVVEMPSWPGHSSPSTPWEKVLAAVERFSRRRLRRYVDRILTFSRETSILGIPTIASDNGVDVGRIALASPPRPGGALRLVGLANLSFWHGYDRVIEGLANYYASGGLIDVHFDVIGTGIELSRLQAAVSKHGLEEKVHFHGAKNGAELESIIAGAHVAVSSLGMHRLDVDTSNLKSREFCARGLPFVIGYPDRDFPPVLPFVFHAPGDDSVLDVAGVMAFHANLRSSHPDYPATMRAYAESHLTWQAKMQPVVEFLRRNLEPGVPR